MEGNLAILEGNFNWVPGKKGIFSSHGQQATIRGHGRCSGGLEPPQLEAQPALSPPNEMTLLVSMESHHFESRSAPLAAPLISKSLATSLLPPDSPWSMPYSVFLYLTNPTKYTKMHLWMSGVHKCRNYIQRNVTCRGYTASSCV